MTSHVPRDIEISREIARTQLDTVIAEGAAKIVAAALGAGLIESRLALHHEIEEVKKRLRAL